MVWIIPQDSDENMFRQLICLMTNIETNKHIFNAQGELVEDEKAFNTYENEFFNDEYRFVKGYIQCTGVTLSNSNIEERMSAMSRFMRRDASTDMSYCYPTSHYTVSRIPIAKEYNRLIAYSEQKMKNIIGKYNFIWVNSRFDVNNFQELQTSKSHVVPETYELMRSLSTIIYDDAGLFTMDNTGQSLVAGRPVNHVNFPEFWQIRGSDKIISIPLQLSKKFSVRGNIRKKFEHLIPDLKKFAPNRAFYKNKNISYRSGGESMYPFHVIESKELNELNLPTIDRKDSAITKVKSKASIYELIKLNLNAFNKNQLSLDVALKYLSCHVCFTPIYGKFYYIIAAKTEAAPQAHVPVCAMCMHNSESTAFGVVNVGVCTSPLTAYDVMSFVPRPSNISHENYEKYKKILEELLDKSIPVDEENLSNILYEKDKILLVGELDNLLLMDPAKAESSVFIVSLVQ